MSTPILPYATWAAGTNQNRIPANDNALRSEILNGNVISLSTTAQPGSPADGDIYIMPATHTGAQWATFSTNDLAIYRGGTWYAYAPVNGVVVNVAGALYRYTGSAWSAAGGTFTGGTLTSALNEAPPVTLASAATVNIGAAASNSVTISGTTTITAFDTIAAGALRHVTFSGALTLTYNATSMQLPGGANITTAAGDVAEMVSLGAGNWKCNAYERASGAALVSSGGFTGGTLTSALNEAPQVTLASAATVNIGAAGANSISISGTTSITAFDTIASGAVRRLVFQGALTLTHSGTALILPGAANITTAAGDVAWMESLGAGNWRCVSYNKANGTAVAAASLSNWTESVNTATPNASTPAVQLIATNAAATVDAVIAPKGGGSLLAQIPDNASSGGNKRGARAVDFQNDRASASSVASGSYACIPGGSNNTASATTSFACGKTNTSSAQSSFSSGEQNTADGTYSSATGYYSLVRGCLGAQAWASGRFSASGDAQARRFVLRASTANATPTVATTDQGAAGASNQIVLNQQCAYKIRGQVVGINASTKDTVSFDISATVKQVGTTVSVVGTSTITQQAADSAMTACAVTLTADATNKALSVNVTGLASTTIRWVASIESVEVV